MPREFKPVDLDVPPRAKVLTMRRGHPVLAYEHLYNPTANLPAAGRDLLDGPRP